MDWLFGLAILPAVLCGLMCIGGMALAALGLRLGSRSRACCDQPSMTAAPPGERVTTDR